MNPRTLLPWLLTAVLAGLVALLPPIAQPLSYHEFADRRACLGLPNCLDTASNALFMLTGAFGLVFLRGAAARRGFIDPREAWPYALFFGGVILIGLASGYYHLAPDNARLAWDRAAMALAFMAWFAAIVSGRGGPAPPPGRPKEAHAPLGGAASRFCERGGPFILLPLLVVAGVGSVAYWAWSEARGSGDLRPYLLLQLAPMLLIPLLLWLYPPRYSHDRDILTVIGLYLLALLFDLTDRPVFALTSGLVSGHTLKHGIAALAVVWVVRYLRRRQIR